MATKSNCQLGNMFASVNKQASQSDSWEGLGRFSQTFPEIWRFERDQTCTPTMFVIISSLNRCTGGIKPNYVCFVFFLHCNGSETPPLFGSIWICVQCESISEKLFQNSAVLIKDLIYLHVYHCQLLTKVGKQSRFPVALRLTRFPSGQKA